MSDVVASRRNTRKPRGRGGRPSPTDGLCECCARRVGRHELKWHHCHDCEKFVAWLCNDCNLSLTEHAIEYWGELEKVHEHPCYPQAKLLRHDPIEVVPEERGGPSKRLYMANGGGDGRYISASTVPGHITVEQLAAVLGVNANTARDIASGRQTNRPIGTRIGGSWFISFDNALAHMEKRWNSQLSPTSPTTPEATRGTSCSATRANDSPN